MDKRGYEFSFAWIFTLMIGAVIIFLAIYAAFQFSDTLRFGRDSATAKKIGILLTPLETSLESGRSYPLIVSEETTLFTNCVDPREITNFFGSQEISVAVKSDIAKKDDSETPGVKSRFNNKYIFAENRTVGKDEFYILSKPFYYPFKIADLTIIWSDQEEFCFVNPDPDIEEEVNDLRLQNIEIKNEKCNNKINVCFNEGCDITVSTTASGGTVTKRGYSPVKYTKSTKSDDQYALLFAAIFSNPEEYQCQLRRLAARAESLTDLYIQKSNNLGNARIINDLESFKTDLIPLKGSLNPDFSQLNPTYLKNTNALAHTRIF